MTRTLHGTLETPAGPLVLQIDLEDDESSATITIHPADESYGRILGSIAPDATSLISMVVDGVDQLTELLRPESA